MAEEPVRPYSVEGPRVLHADGRHGIVQEELPDGQVRVLWGVTTIKGGADGNENIPHPILSVEPAELLAPAPYRVVPPDIVVKRREGRLTTEEYEEWVAPKI